jgi:hypothetical protein
MLDVRKTGFYLIRCNYLRAGGFTRRFIKTSVIPAKAGIQGSQGAWLLDSRLRGNDKR